MLNFGYILGGLGLSATAYTLYKSYRTRTQEEYNIAVSTLKTNIESMFQDKNRYNGFRMIKDDSCERLTLDERKQLATQFICDKLDSKYMIVLKTDNSVGYRCHSLDDCIQITYIRSDKYIETLIAIKPNTDQDVIDYVSEHKTALLHHLIFQFSLTNIGYCYTVYQMRESILKQLVPKPKISFVSYTSKLTAPVKKISNMQDKKIQELPKHCTKQHNFTSGIDLFTAAVLL